MRSQTHTIEFPDTTITTPKNDIIETQTHTEIGYNDTVMFQNNIEGTNPIEIMVGLLILILFIISMDVKERL